MNLDRNDAFVALLFGVFIDLDHLIGFGNYAETKGVASLDLESLMDPGGQWKSALHRPMAIMVVAPASIASRMAVPLVFWGLHVAMDYAQQSFLGNLSQVEAALLVFAGLALAATRYSKLIEGTPNASLSQYLTAELSYLRSVSFGRSKSVMPIA